MSFVGAMTSWDPSKRRSNLHYSNDGLYTPRTEFLTKEDGTNTNKGNDRIVVGHSEKDKRSNHEATMTRTSALLCLLASVMVSFTFGRMTRYFLLSRHFKSNHQRINRSAAALTAESIDFVKRVNELVFRSKQQNPILKPSGQRNYLHIRIETADNSFPHQKKHQHLLQVIGDVMRNHSRDYDAPSMRCQPSEKNRLSHTGRLSTDTSMEALVHPAMFVHEEPERVALIGKNCAAIHEVLKHKSVESLSIFEGSKCKHERGCENEEIYPCCSYTTDAANGSCLNDTRVVVINQHFNEWIIDHGFDSCNPQVTANHCATEQKPFDVIIVVTGIQTEMMIATPDLTMNALFCTLSNMGVLAMPLGNSPLNSKRWKGTTLFPNVDKMMASLGKSDYESIHIYEESHGDFRQPQSYMVLCKSYECRWQWYLSEALVNVRIHKRFDQTNASLPVLSYFDGATMMRYQRPPKSWEKLFCQNEPTPAHCRARDGFDPAIPNVPIGQLEVRKSTLGDNAGRGIFTKVNISRGSYVLLESAVHSVQFLPPTVDVIRDLLRDHTLANEIQVVLTYMDGYGYDSDDLGQTGNFVDSGISTFMNHGCNGTYNFGQVGLRASDSYPGSYLTEQSANPNVFPDDDWRHVFNPILDRHLEHSLTSFDGATRDISQGEELFSNYLFYVAEEEDWPENVRQLRAQCGGEEIGLVVLVDTQ